MENVGILYVHLQHFSDIWNNLRPFGIFFGHLVYFMAIWFILWPFGNFAVIWYGTTAICHPTICYKSDRMSPVQLSPDCRPTQCRLLQCCPPPTYVKLIFSCIVKMQNELSFFHKSGLLTKIELTTPNLTRGNNSDLSSPTVGTRRRHKVARHLVGRHIIIAPFLSVLV
jgi:hypothetical protein